MSKRFIKKIGWQKYEDYIEKQLTSPMLTSIIQNVALQHIEKLESDDEEEEEEEDDYEVFEEKPKISSIGPTLPLTPQIMDDIAMLSSFDCWLGHTNFDLTHSIKDVLNKIPGIEVLKICSRYRFFVGIGRMFDFALVRNDIEKALLGDHQ